MSEICGTQLIRIPVFFFSVSLRCILTGLKIPACCKSRKSHYCALSLNDDLARYRILFITGEWITKMWYPAIKRNEVLIHATVLVEP